jgi:hypothetical protein
VHRGAYRNLEKPRGAWRSLGVAWGSLKEPGQEPTVAYLDNVYLVARLSVDNLNKQCFHNTTYTYIYVLRTTLTP